MNEPTGAPSAELQSKALVWMLFVVSLAFGWILLPFHAPIMWAAIIALLFAPLYRWGLRMTNQRRSLTALLTLMTALVIVVIPLVLLSAAFAREASSLYERIQSGQVDPALYLRGVFDALPPWATVVLDRFGLVDFDTLQRRLSVALAQGSQFIATQALSAGQNTLEFIVGPFIAFYLAFFLIRDGRSVATALEAALPLAPAHKRALLDTFGTVIRATVKGSLLVAAIQGALGGVAFWMLGVSGALLWGVLMGFLSLLPAVGAALVWLPVAVYFVVTGATWQGIALMAYGVLVIGLIDNLLRPMLVGQGTRVPDSVLMISTLGGVAALGINGFIIGPVLAAMFMATWHIYARHGAGS